MKNTIYIKNMVCPRCITAVSTILGELNISYHSIQLGEVDLDMELDDQMKQGLSDRLEKSGFSLIRDRKTQLIEQMKTLVLQKLRYSGAGHDTKLPHSISDQLNLDYKYLSSLFSSVEELTFEQYIINQKIEYVKELIVYDELNLSQIADQLHYSSVAYLSSQFKKVTGMTPSQFKKSTAKNRLSLDAI